MNKFYFVFGERFSNFRLLDYVFQDINQARDFAESNDCKLFLTAEEAASYMNIFGFEKEI